MNLKTAADEPRWSALAKGGALQKAFDLYRSKESSSAFKAIKFRLALAIPRRMVAWVAAPVIRVLLTRLDWNTDYTAVDLSSAFILFWKKSDRVGLVLLIPILQSAVRTKKVPARSVVWLAHWLVFQGRYADAILLFRRLREATKEDPQIRSELTSLLGNYFYVRGKFEPAKRYFERTHRSTLASGNHFLNLFNLGLWVMVAASEGELNSLAKITSYFDALDPDQPDERYGLRLLAVSAYLQIKFGNPDLGNRYWISATRVMEQSGSPLDRAIYLAFKSLIDILAGDQANSLVAIQQAEKELQSFGTYAYYRDLLKALSLKFSGDEVTARQSRQEFKNHRGISKFLDSSVKSANVSAVSASPESWYRRYFEVALPLIEAADTLERDELIAVLKEQSLATQFSWKVEASGQRVEPFHRTSLLTEGARFEFNFVHREEICTVDLTTPFLPWRNRDVFVALKSMTLSLQVSSFQDLQKQRISEEKSALQMAQLARQVAHDIRSPLSALTLVAGCATGLTEEQQMILKASARRIQAIAADLLESHKKQIPKMVGTLSEPDEAISLQSLVLQAVQEKRVEYADRNVHIQIENKADPLPLPARVNSHVLRVVLSNLINNSFEAIRGSGQITLSILSEADGAVLSIRDNGAGIDAVQLEKLRNGVSISTKEHGSGLGVRHARAQITKWNARLDIDSEVGRGTTVKLRFAAM